MKSAASSGKRGDISGHLCGKRPSFPPWLAGRDQDYQGASHMPLLAKVHPALPGGGGGQRAKSFMN